jgi:hypothetical protein
MNRLLELIERLSDAVERRESADPDLGSWQAEAEVQRLEQELIREYRLVRLYAEDDPTFPQGSADRTLVGLG